VSWDALAARVAAARRAASGERALRKVLGAHEASVHNRVWTDPVTGFPRFGGKVVDGAPIHVRMSGVTHQFREDQADELEGFVSAVDAELSKPEYRIRRSLELENAILARAEEDGVLKLIKAAADQVIQSGDADAIVVGMRAHEAVVRGPDVTLAACHQALLIFVCPEDEAVRRIQAIQAPQRRPAPEKVAVKMVILRIRKLQEQVKEINRFVQGNIEQAAGQNKALPSELTTFMPGIPTDGGRGALEGYLSLCQTHRGRRPYEKTLQDLRKVLGRPDVTDDVVEEAMKVAQVEEVMLS
jgi:hypothetical protein